eukprot:6207783-Pleurochrysis_carterae.AAC.1
MAGSVDDPNSCPEGMHIWVPRTEKISEGAHAKFGYTATRLFGIVGSGPPPLNYWKNCGGCTDFAMNSDTPEQSAFWTSIGPRTGGPAEPWFLRKHPYREPTGDYFNGCAFARHFCFCMHLAVVQAECVRASRERELRLKSMRLSPCSKILLVAHPLPLTTQVLLARQRVH